MCSHEWEEDELRMRVMSDCCTGWEEREGGGREEKRDREATK